MQNPIEQFLEEVSWSVGGATEARVLQEALAEMRSHLEESAAGFEELGADKFEAEKLAVLAFGNKESAQQAILKRISILDHSIFPLGGITLLIGVASITTAIYHFLPDSVQTTGVVCLLCSIVVFAIRGYIRRRIEWTRIGFSLVASAALAMLLVAPFLRAELGSGLQTLQQFEIDRQANEKAWSQMEAIENADFAIMKSVVAGNTESMVRQIQGNNGYLMPRGLAWSYTDGRKFTQNFETALAAWKKESYRFDLDKRIAFSQQARDISRVELAALAKLNYWGNIRSLIKDNGYSTLFLWVIITFCQAIGLLTRMIAELATRVVQNSKRSRSLRS